MNSCRMSEPLYKLLQMQVGDCLSAGDFTYMSQHSEGLKLPL